MLKLIAAVDSNWLLGVNNSIPWHYSIDFKRFKNITLGSILIMGENTVLSLPKPLKNRTIIGISPDKKISTDFVVSSFHEAIEKALSTRKDETIDVWIAGGGFVYNQALDHSLVTHLDITFVPKYKLNENDKNPVFFPKQKLNNFVVEDQFVNCLDERLTHKIYRRIKP